MALQEQLRAIQWSTGIRVDDAEEVGDTRADDGVSGTAPMSTLADNGVSGTASLRSSGVFFVPDFAC